MSTISDLTQNSGADYVSRILSSLDIKQQQQLIKDSSNPNPEKSLTTQAATNGRPTFTQSTTSVPARPSIKETIAAQKKAARERNLPSRPGSAEPFQSPKKSTSQSSMARPATAMSASRNASVSSVGTLSSAPVRPRRRADNARPATAETMSHRKPTKTETPPRSPAVSPQKRTKTPLPHASTVKLAPRKLDSPASNSPARAGVSRFGFHEGARLAEPNNNLEQPQSSPTKAAEDFTMVMPNLPSMNRSAEGSLHDTMTIGPQLQRGANLGNPFIYNEAKNTQWPPSPQNDSTPNGSPLSNSRQGGAIPRLSPSRLANDLERTSINNDKPQRMSPSPKAIGSRKERLTPKTSHLQDQKPLQVYEDPDHDSNDRGPYAAPRNHSPNPPKALGELPVNEPTKQHRDNHLLAEESIGPEYHQKWRAVEEGERRRISAQENIDNPHMARKILDSGIDRVRARTLDVHGFRKLQTLIRTSGDSIWEGGYKFDELILPLLDYLEVPSDGTTARPNKAQDLKTQQLVTVRLLLQYQPRYFSGYYPRAIAAVLAARKYYNSTSHIVSGLEETAESIVSQCDPLPCIDSALDLLETELSNGTENNTTVMSLYVLAGLLHRTREVGPDMGLGDEQEQRLGDLGSRYLSDTNPDIRRAVIEFVLELHEAVQQERFWGLVTGAKEDHRSLITYYLARKRDLEKRNATVSGR